VYFGSFDGYLYALSPTGTVRWKHHTSGKIQSSPRVHDGTIYVGTRTGDVYAIDRDRGTRSWVYETDGTIYRSSPQIADSKLYIGLGGIVNGVHGLSLENGERQWEFETGIGVFHSPKIDQGVLYVGTSNEGNQTGKVYAIDI
jgi:outer membrane protein assembly factor BamB